MTKIELKNKIELLEKELQEVIVESDSKKLTINGSFGKFGSVYSILYSPKLLVQVTLTGQLSLLMLIESLENHGIKVVSANTDGIVIKCQKNKEKILNNLVRQWEQITSFNMESTDYKSIYSRDISNYIAIKSDHDVKTKGCFAKPWLGKNPQNDICTEAIIQFLINGEPIEKTITNCNDITKFLTLRTVKGGAIKNKEYIGKNIRWYYSTQSRGTINYKTNNNTVPKTWGAKPCMELPDQFPGDIDYQWYINETKEMMNGLGLNAIGQMSLF